MSLYDWSCSRCGDPIAVLARSAPHPDDRVLCPGCARIEARE